MRGLILLVMLFLLQPKPSLSQYRSDQFGEFILNGRHGCSPIKKPGDKPGEDIQKCALYYGVSEREE